MWTTRFYPKSSKVDGCWRKASEFEYVTSIFCTACSCIPSALIIHTGLRTHPPLIQPQNATFNVAACSTHYSTSCTRQTFRLPWGSSVQRALGISIRRKGAQFISGSPQHRLTFFSAMKPPPPGQKRVKEDWENIWYIGMYGSMAFAAVMLYYKPDTRYALRILSPGHIWIFCITAYRRGLWRRRRNGWKPVGRSIYTNPHLQHHQHNFMLPWKPRHSLT